MWFGGFGSRRPFGLAAEYATIPQSFDNAFQNVYSALSRQGRIINSLQSRFQDGGCRWTDLWSVSYALVQIFKTSNEFFSHALASLDSVLWLCPQIVPTVQSIFVER